MNSKLQIISGKYKGRKLNLPTDARPTQNRARIALFNMMESGIIESDSVIMIWDAFAGSGAFGLECLSRYHNARVLFTDVSSTSIKTVRDNLSVLQVGNCATANQIDALAVLSKYGPEADVVFIDPPYSEHDLGVAFVNKFAKVAKNGVILIWEQDNTNYTVPNVSDWTILRDKTYGRARFLILQKNALV